MAIAKEFDKIPPTISAVMNRRQSIEANISLLRALQKIKEIRISNMYLPPSLTLLKIEHKFIIFQQVIASLSEQEIFYY